MEEIVSESKERRRYNIKCTKIEPGDRDVYGEYAAGYLEIHGGDENESVPVGGEARYSVELTDSGAEAFRAAHSASFAVSSSPWLRAP